MHRLTLMLVRPRPLEYGCYLRGDGPAAPRGPALALLATRTLSSRWLDLIANPPQGKRQPLFNAVASRLSPLSNMNKAKPDCPQVELICETIGACAALQC
jgi:hypothetical protein